ncbi:MAG: LCP family protein, partial [Candidatus Methylomirabilales bacterium]
MRRKTSTITRDLPLGEIIRPGRRRRPRWRLPGLPGGIGLALKYVAIALVVATVLGGGLLTYASLKLKGASQPVEAISPRKPDEPMNVLVLGSDSRAVLPESDQERFDPTGQDRRSGRRADTIILVHLDEQRDKVVIVSFPRDLRVGYPEGKAGRINATYQRGPDAVVGAIESFTALPIHHFVEINFVGFREIVDALGGVRVHFERAIREPDSGLNVPAGCVELKGDQALAFVRVRKIDDDFGRITRQQIFLRLMAEKMISARTLMNPLKVLRLINQGFGAVTTDPDLSLGDVKALTLRLRGFDPERVDMRVVPSTPERIGGVAYVIADQRQSDSLFAAIRERRPLPDFGRTGVSDIAPSDIRISVLNGTTARGLAAAAAERLKGRGFEVMAVTNA